MDYVSDSDAENSLPPLAASAVDVELLRDVYTIFSATTRRRLREQAQGSPFARLYDSIDADLAQSWSRSQSPTESVLHDAPETQPRISLLSPIALLDDQSLSQERPGPVVDQVHSGRSTQLDVQQPATPSASTNSVTPTARPFSSRSLRKRTFASRHPYVADQADWLGICTVDSINEMFSADEDIGTVIRALNQLYLQKKRRYPDEDRYRSKDFYSHLGHSKLLALQGDQDIRSQSDRSSNSASNIANSQDMPYDELNYSSDDHRSVAEASEDEDLESQLIPYELFDIPSAYSKPISSLRKNSSMDPDIELIGDVSNDQASFSDNDDTDASRSETEENEDSDEEEQYIRIGGRYRKLSTILRGVLPESAKRLMQFSSSVPKKRTRSATRTLAPRKGLAVRKNASAGSKSTDLERELSAYAYESDNRSFHPTLHQPLISEFEQNRKEPVPSTVRLLSRNSSTLSYASASPEPQYLTVNSETESESGIEPETALSETLSAITPGYKPEQHKDVCYVSDGSDEAHESDQVDRLLIRSHLSNSNRKIATKHRPSNYTLVAKSRAPKLPYMSRPKATKNASSRKPLATKSRTNLKRSFAGARNPYKARKIQSTFPSQRSTSSDKENQHKLVRNEQKLKHGPDHFALKRWPQSEFRRDPVRTTSTVEVESPTIISGPSPTIRNPIPHSFLPLKDLLSVSSPTSAMNSLVCLDEIQLVKTIRNGRILFPNMSRVSFSLMGKYFSFDLVQSQESMSHSVSFLKYLRKVLSSPHMLLEPQKKAETITSLRNFMNWLLILRVSPSEALWKSLRSILDDFSKFQTKELIKCQLEIHSQLLFIFYILAQLEQSLVRSNEQKYLEDLTNFSSDYFSKFFQSFTASEVSAASVEGSEDHTVLESVFLVYTLFDDTDRHWWPAIVQALGESSLLKCDNRNLLDLTYVLAAIVPKHSYSWSPFLTVLNRFKALNDSRFFHYFINTCELVHQRLDWPFEERVVTSIYGFFAARKFGNFPDETAIPSLIQRIHTKSDIPYKSAFDRFLLFVFTFISDLSSLKEVKRLISKLLASSQYQYSRARISQIRFCNRMNLIVLLSQVCSVDFRAQFVNLLNQVADSTDTFIYGRSLSALFILCETAKEKQLPLPLEAFGILFKSFSKVPAQKAGQLSLFQKMIDFWGHNFQGPISEGNSGTLGLFALSSTLDLSIVPDPIKSTMLGVLTFAMNEMLFDNLKLNENQLSIMEAFQKSLLRFLGNQMNRLPVACNETDNLIEEAVEMAIQIWIMQTRVCDTQHWNIMMLQKYAYIGNSISRQRFIMFFCLEFIHYGEAEKFVLEEVDKIFLTSLIWPSLPKYAFELYRSLSHNPNSIFYSKKSIYQEITSAFTFQTYRVHIIARSIENILSSTTIHVEEKALTISAFVRALNDQFTMHSNDDSVVDLCKRMIELLQQSARTQVYALDDFWELSSKLGYPNRRMQSMWVDSDNTGKIQILNKEFILALHYDKDYQNALNNWITPRNTSVLYSLVEIYVGALHISDTYWAHLSFLLRYVLEKLEKFRIDTKDLDFKYFLRLIKEISLSAGRHSNSRYIIFELLSISICARILSHAFVLYHGFKDQNELRSLILDFISNLASPAPRQNRIQQHFTDATVEGLRSGNTIMYYPRHEHTLEQYNAAVNEQKKYLNQLESLVKVEERSQEISRLICDFQFQL